MYTVFASYAILWLFTGTLYIQTFENITVTFVSSDRYDSGWRGVMAVRT
jgi:hypothetical protein